VPKGAGRTCLCGPSRRLADVATTISYCDALQLYPHRAPRAIRETLGLEVQHRTSRDMNNRMEQDHRGLTQRSYPMRSFGSFGAAARFCSAHDALRDHLRYRQHLNETVSLAAQRPLFVERCGAVCAVLQAA